MAIQAIETRYAGCRFRSRLEARWAVFFDHLRIPWEYEPQGIQATWRLDCSNETFPYLPDFWLPSENLWVEVKGSLDNQEISRLLNAAASLSSNDGGGCHDSGGSDLVILGPVPRPGVSRYPARLHMHKGDLIASPWPICDPHSSYYLVGDDCHGVNWKHADVLLRGFITKEEHPTRPWLPKGEALVKLGLYDEALATARSARFEHGERP